MSGSGGRRYDRDCDRDRDRDRSYRDRDHQSYRDRDDKRQYKHDEGDGRRRSRSRSGDRERRRHDSDEYQRRRRDSDEYQPPRSRRTDEVAHESYQEHNSDRRQFPTPPPSGIRMTLSGSNVQNDRSTTDGITGTPVKGGPPASKLKMTLQPPAPAAPPVRKVAAIFGDDSDEEVEEMPPEARMRMKNVGRDTPTSAGPNSFGKTKLGFCNVIHITEKEVEAGAAAIAPSSSRKK